MPNFSCVREASINYGRVNSNMMGQSTFRFANAD